MMTARLNRCERVWVPPDIAKEVVMSFWILSETTASVISECSIGVAHHAGSRLHHPEASYSIAYLADPIANPIGNHFVHDLRCLIGAVIMQVSRLHDPKPVVSSPGLPWWGSSGASCRKPRGL